MFPFPIPSITLIYILFCIVVAVLGRERKFGFWGYFFSSILFTPPVGLLLVIASDRRH